MKSFVISYHHKWYNKSAFVSGALQYVISIFESISEILGFNGINSNTIVLEGLSFRELKEDNLKDNISDVIFGVALCLFDRFILFLIAFEGHLVYDFNNKILDILFESFNDDILFLSS